MLVGRASVISEIFSFIGSVKEYTKISHVHWGRELAAALALMRWTPWKVLLASRTNGEIT